MSESISNSAKKSTTKVPEPEQAPVTMVRMSNTDRAIAGASLAVQGANAVFNGLAAFDSTHDLSE